VNEPLVEREFGERLFFVSKRFSHAGIATTLRHVATAADFPD